MSVRPGSSRARVWVAAIAAAGFIAAATGWVWFFVICALAGIPSLVLLWWLQRSGHFDRLETRP